jgi:hypothetical protein
MNGNDMLEAEEAREFNCEKCEDKGFYEKTEWTGTDDSHEVEVKCECNED